MLRSNKETKEHHRKEHKGTVSPIFETSTVQIEEINQEDEEAAEWVGSLSSGSKAALGDGMSPRQQKSFYAAMRRQQSSHEEADDMD